MLKMHCGGITGTTAQTNLNRWYASQGHKENMLNTRSLSSAIAVYVQGENTYVLQLFDILSVEELNEL